MKLEPKVGVGVIISNANGELLVGKRENAVAPYYSIPGGHLETGESFEEAAIREVEEETGLRIKNPQVIAVTNNLRTFREEGVHTISIILYTANFEGVPVVKEPDKCSCWRWVSPFELPQPHFDASEQAVACFINKKMYQP